MNDQNQVAAESMESGQVCETHNVQMEWIVSGGYKAGGFWFCQACWDDAEAELLREPEYVPADLSDVALPLAPVDEDGVGEWK